MNPADLLALMPLIVLAATAVLVMLVAAFRPAVVLSAVLAALGLAAAFVATVLTAPLGTRQVTALLYVDPYARFYTGLLVLASLAVELLSFDYLRRRGESAGAFYTLLLLATLGSAVLVSSSHFASFFLGLETLSVALYGLIAYTVDRSRSVEAGIKYLILAAASAAFLLFGMALVYAVTGSMSFAQVASRTAAAGAAPGVVLLVGQAMLVVGFGFKLAVVPFHMWTPDVYEGAPAPVTGFVASVSKGAMFALLLRYFVTLNLAAIPPLWLVFALIAAASILAGNLLALLQNNIKRLLAYSSIANMGYVMVAFLSSGPSQTLSVTFYLVAYFVTILAAFGVVSVVSSGENDAGTLEDYRALFWRHPWLATILTAAMLSLAGIPLTAGFIGKFYILAAAGASALWWLAIILVVGSAIGLYYYLRVIVMMYLDRPAAAAGMAPAVAVLTGASGAVLAALMVAVLLLGVYPTPLIGLIQAIAAR